MQNKLWLVVGIFCGANFAPAMSVAQVVEPPAPVEETPDSESDEVSPAPVEEAPDSKSDEVSPEPVEDGSDVGASIEGSEGESSAKSAQALELVPDPDGDDIRLALSRGLEFLKSGQFEKAKQLFDQVADKTLLAERKEVALSLSAYASRLETLVRKDPEKKRAITSGRVEFIVTSTLIGAYAGGVLIDLTGISDVRLGVATVMLTTGAALTGAIFGTRNKGIRAAEGSAYTIGALWGGATSVLVWGIVGPKNEELVTLTVFGSVAGSGLGSFFLTREIGATAGQVSIVGNGAFMGFSTSAMLIPVIGFEDLNVPLLLFSGLQIGTGVGVWSSLDSNWSSDRATLALLGGGVGSLGLWGLTTLVVGEDSNKYIARIWSGSAIAGLWGGYALTAYLTRNMEPDEESLPVSNLSLSPMFGEDFKGLGIAGSF